MREYRFLVNRNPFEVKLPDLENKTTFEAEVNGRSIVVELSQAVSPSKPFFIIVDGKPYQVELDRHKKSWLTTAKINGASYIVVSENKSPRGVLKPSMSTSTVKRRPVKTMRLGKGVVAASMPGKVALVRVKVGDRVKTKDVLLILESMKMENEIVSPVNGSVKEVKISQGDAVNIGETMVVIDET